MTRSRSTRSRKVIHAAIPPARRVLVVAAAVFLAGFSAAGELAAAGPAGRDTEQIDVVAVKSLEHAAPEGLLMRVRLQRITPADPSPIDWRHGGEGQGGEVVRGTFPKPGSAADADQTLDVGQWSDLVPVTSLVKGRFPGRLFLTVTAGRPGKVVDRVTRELADYSRDVVFEFEFQYRGAAVKRLTEAGPDGGTVTIVIPAYRLVENVTPADPEFLGELTGVLAYASRRAERLKGLPWAAGPLPKKFLLVNNISGYGQGYGYGIRTTDKAVTWAELGSLRQLGTNGLRTPPEFLMKMLRGGQPEAQPFRRGLLMPTMGFPVPRYTAGRVNDPEAGCPLGEHVAQRTEEAVQASLEEVLGLTVDEVWGLTVDEIGAVTDQAPEGKAHLSVCPRCAAGFQAWLAAQGLSPADFGKRSWPEVRPLNVWDPQAGSPWLDDSGAAMAAYWTLAFNNHVTAALFTPLRDAIAAANEAKRQALAAGSPSDPAARQPWVHSFALRGNTFLMKGHSLDFFDFYREADNAIVYETSNREPRIWAWDSYLCDVQRVVGQRMHVAQGIYIKPHRGAPVQRMLSAVGRGDRMIYWYTYGPDYHKGDSFSQDPEALKLASKAAHLLGRAEDALWDATWTVPAEVAVVKPETTQRWMSLSGNPPHLTAAWENAKWVYTALQHAHVPVDPLDERMLVDEDLSRYRAIYVCGSHVTRAAAESLARYVEQGGTLWTSGWGLVRDEANRPLAALAQVLGLQNRNDPEMWYQVELYGATRLEPYDDPRKQLAAVPPGARIEGSGLFEGSLTPRIGREVLLPRAEAGVEVLARFADGAVAATCHPYGKGRAYVVGFFPGLEYSAAIRTDRYDMRRDLQQDAPVACRRMVAAPALLGTSPVVDAADPLVEGVLLSSADGKTMAVTLANWAYGATAIRQDAEGRQEPIVTHLPLENLKITVRHAGDVTRVTSCMLDRSLPLTTSDDKLTVVLPLLEEGDVLLLH